MGCAESAFNIKINVMHGWRVVRSTLVTLEIVFSYAAFLCDGGWNSAVCCGRPSLLQSLLAWSPCALRWMSSDSI